ncbi:uncharacterized protein J3R85_013619 [Psidium guajava]|nr:uncharacterized protein J3R85_013619 [Psidium guajava]
MTKLRMRLLADATSKGSEAPHFYYESFTSHGGKLQARVSVFTNSASLG